MERKDHKIITKVSDTFVKGCLTPLLLLFLMFFWQIFTAYGYVANSAGYRMETDAISVGGLLGTSAGYSIEDSVSGSSFAESSGSSFALKSGYIPMSEPYLAVSMPSNVSMSPAINMVGGGTGNGSASWTVTTDSSGGYSLLIKASTDPALKSVSDSFSNYSTQVVGVPDYSLITGTSVNFFGFTPEGIDISSLYKDDGASLCNVGSNDTIDKCWDSITTGYKAVSSSVSANHPSGTATTIKFRAYAGSSVTKTAGSYSATITVTALAL